jgi:hypothetical protein
MSPSVSLTPLEEVAMSKDAAGHEYVDVENIRLTYVPASDRSRAADWAQSDVIRLQAYKGPHDRSLHMGAELPVSSSDTFVRLIEGLCKVYGAGKGI